jgi:ABC-2 type transport system permease protein
LRSREPIHRTLTDVEASTKSLLERQVEESGNAEKEAKKQFEELSAKLQEEVDRISADTTLDPNTKRVMIDTAQKNKQKELDAKKVEIEDKKKRTIKAAKERTEREIRVIEDSARFAAIILPPIPALLLGIFVLAIRIKDERQGILPDRLVSRK